MPQSLPCEVIFLILSQLSSPSDFFAVSLCSEVLHDETRRLIFRDLRLFLGSREGTRRHKALLCLEKIRDSHDTAYGHKLQDPATGPGAWPGRYVVSLSLELPERILSSRLEDDVNMLLDEVGPALSQMINLKQ
jgi:hypothetical protein